MIKKILLAGTACMVVLTSMIAEKSNNSANTVSNKPVVISSEIDNSAKVNYWIDSMYSTMKLAEKGLSRSVFFDACKGYEYMLLQNQLKKQGLLTICDYSQRSNKKRLYVLDLNQAKVLYNTYVSHGRNSGNDYATSFSNSNESHKSSLGFMRTAETYNGENGYSMRLDGFERGFNDNVRTRAIVMHGSDYVTPARALNGVMMGRSYGCPSVPVAEAKKIINCIKDGSCFFNYYPDKKYAQSSAILNADFVWPLAPNSYLAFAKISDTLNELSVTAKAFN